MYLQESLGLNTIESAACLAKNNESIDFRFYSGVIAVIQFLGLDPARTHIDLSTNNPDKIAIFKENGYTVSDTSVIIPPTEFTEKHLAAKKTHLKHKLD